MNGDEFDEKSLERALRAPGSPAELNGEGEYLAMFRTTRSAGSSAGPVAGSPRAGRRAVRRLGASSTLAVVFAVTTAGVAAAYSSNLPAPVQRAVHSVLAPLGVPAAEPRQPVADPQPRRAPEPTPTEAPAPPPPAPTRLPVAPVQPSHKPSMSPLDSTSPSMDPSVSASPTTPVTESASPSDTPDPSPTDPTESPTSTADPDPTSSPSSSPSSTGTPPPVAPPASVRISSAGAGQKVAPGGTAIVTGRVTAADGSPVPDVRVVLQAHGSAGWRRLAVTRSAADGSVAVASGPITKTAVVRLRAQRVLSAPRQLVVQPTLTASATTGDTTATITVTSNGGRSGEQVLLLTRRSGQLVLELRGRLDAAGGVRFDVAAPVGVRTYVVRLEANAAHATAEARVAVSPPAAVP